VLHTEHMEPQPAGGEQGQDAWATGRIQPGKSLAMSASKRLPGARKPVRTHVLGWSEANGRQGEGGN